MARGIGPGGAGGTGTGDPDRARRVLVVEDEPSIAGSIVRGFKAAGFVVELATDGLSGLHRFRQFRPDLVILDLNLPQRNGFDFLRSLPPGSKVPVFVVTARTGLEDRLRSFDLGAVDFLPKPFFVEELLVRARKRLEPRDPERTPVFEWDGAVVDLDSMEVTVDGSAAGLTREEFAILAHLAGRPGRAVSRRLLADLSGEPGEDRSERTVDSHVVRIRKKLGRASWRIATVWGIGYRFERRVSREDEPG